LKKFDIWQLGETHSGLIVKCRSGILFSNQTGGTTCSHPEQEGVFLPMALPRDDGLVCVRDRVGITDAQADKLDEWFAYHGFPFTVSRPLLQYSNEAWIHIRIVDGSERSRFLQVSGFAAILVWKNSN
jgi:hypothetical protein